MKTIKKILLFIWKDALPVVGVLAVIIFMYFFFTSCSVQKYTNYNEIQQYQYKTIKK